MRITITSDAELSAALERAEELMGCTTDSEEEQELAEIAEAIEAYPERCPETLLHRNSRYGARYRPSLWLIKR